MPLHSYSSDACTVQQHCTHRHYKILIQQCWWCRYKVIFEPQKTVSAKVVMVVEKSTGGRWRFELRLEATQPDVDGSVTIQAAPGQSALGPVLLYSPTDQPEPFTCHFTHDSSISFDVSPSEVRSNCCIGRVVSCTQQGVRKATLVHTP